jgi:hypothetical protein
VSRRKTGEKAMKSLIDLTKEVLKLLILAIMALEALKQLFR